MALMKLLICDIKTERMLYVTEQINFQITPYRAELVIDTQGPDGIMTAPVRWGRLHWGKAAPYSWLLPPDLEALVIQAAAEIEPQLIIAVKAA